MEFLLRNGADPYKFYEEETVLDYAKEFLEDSQDFLNYALPFYVPAIKKSISILDRYVNKGWKKVNEDEKDLNARGTKKFFKKKLTDTKSIVDEYLNYHHNKI